MDIRQNTGECEMSLINEIAGLKGENLSSALLAHLMLRSPDLRAYMVGKISDIAPAGPVSVANQFAVFLEQSARLDKSPNDTSPTANGGRIDIVIETDDAVIGIENKFNAPFQENQPEGYLQSLEKRASQLKELRGNEFSSVLIVLAPARRKAEISNYLKNNCHEKVAFLSWKEVLDGARDIEGLSSIDRYLIRELHTFVDHEVGNIRELRKLLPHLKKSWNPRGTSAQYKFLNNFIWGLLAEEIRHSDYYQSSAGNEFYGWYLRPRMDASLGQAWIGFIKADGDQAKAAFIFATNPPGGLEPMNVPHVEQFKPISGWSDNWQLFKVGFDDGDEWENHEKWADVLEPLNSWLQKNLQTDTTP